MGKGGGINYVMDFLWFISSVLIIGLLFEDEVSTAVSWCVLVASINAIISCLGAYNSTKATADKQIAVFEQRNDEVIAQINFG